MKRYRVGFSRNRPAARDMFRQELEVAVQLLETSPLIGRLYPEAPVPEVRRFLIGQSRYHIYWEVDAAFRTVTILAIWYAGRGSGPRL